jgi:endogenous inhibitor of DNA gyrase (YacG/DUF329 family)
MKVKCPACGKDSTLDPQNKFRPFCSERCAILDLGSWADENYRVPVEQQNSPVNENTENEEEDSSTEELH